MCGCEEINWEMVVKIVTVIVIFGAIVYLLYRANVIKEDNNPWRHQD